MNDLSLRTRLLLYILLIALLVWGAASSLAWWQTRHAIDEVFDTQQMLFAKRLATANLSELTAEDAAFGPLPKTRHLVGMGDSGRLDDDALGFAIFDERGALLLSDNDHGHEFGYSAQTGFLDKPLEGDDDEMWRILYITTPDKRFTIAVGQEKDYRSDLVNEIVFGQLWPWLFGLPLMMLLTAWIVRRELFPLKHTADELAQRTPDDSTPLAPESVPPEARPMVTALNALFVRVSSMLERERQFTADAAHELRSPLTALRIQSEVALLAEENGKTRRNALNNLITGIDRTSRLVDQLLALSRLDGNSSLMSELNHIDWRRLAAEVVEEATPTADQKAITLTLQEDDLPEVVKGNPVLLKMLLGNLVNNALRYTQQGGAVTVTLQHSRILVTDNGPGVMPSHLTRLGERFFRPPGATENGSGLGLSIVKRIARLHDFQICWQNRPEGGFQVVVGFAGQ
ncbi:quorum sensing histidine kinase QseC [Entomohabitans teleogrylli]|uniref:quorum sensing histidine kinase QseC n=1 Tax=Entomohabitans teleogrylli TaxID=1384589 RepID=UPI00073D5F62|nr:quorum sensing histidine kinase QseC [Entomohabitans teleogrylli]